MKILSSPLRSLVILITSVGVLGALFADEPTPPPEPTVLVLKSGQVFHGKVVQAGERYLVISDLGETRVNKQDVDFLATNMQDAYRQKRARTEWGNVETHLAMTEWCLRSRLFAEADQELAWAEQADANHPRISLYRRRLELERSEDGLVQQATALADAAPQADQALAEEDGLNEMLRRIPSGSMDAFTRSIQPLLLNRCGGGGCHGPRADNGFHLVKIGSRHALSQRTTQRNLQSVLQFVDFEAPHTSALVTVPVRSHGRRGPIFTERDREQYGALVDWIKQVSKRRQGLAGPIDPREVDADDGPLFPEEGAGLEVPGSEELPQSRRGSGSSTGEDPFDPAAFNAQFHGPGAEQSPPPGQTKPATGPTNEPKPDSGA